MSEETSTRRSERTGEVGFAGVSVVSSVDTPVSVGVTSVCGVVIVISGVFTVVSPSVDGVGVVVAVLQAVNIAAQVKVNANIDLNFLKVISFLLYSVYL